jgi:hypothetical protein
MLHIAPLLYWLPLALCRLSHVTWNPQLFCVMTNTFPAVTAACRRCEFHVK